MCNRRHASIWGSQTALTCKSVSAWSDGITVQTEGRETHLYHVLKYRECVERYIARTQEMRVRYVRRIQMIKLARTTANVMMVIAVER